jgi:hypothetical protein
VKLSDYKQAYYDFSGLASSTSRQLAFAGVAIIWIFKLEQNGGIVLPSSLLIPATLFIAALGADLLHYYVASIIWGVFHRCNEKKQGDSSDDPELKAPSFANLISIVLYNIKILLVLIGYIYLLIFGLSRFDFA